jgi:hypothetical protein
MRPPTKTFLTFNFEFLILFFTFSFLLLTCSYADYADGDGSPEFPYEIAEPNQLIYMSQHPEDWDKHFILTADINLALAEPNTFTYPVIGSFTGTFDGNGHTISNLTI